jgi:hypothetical protein
VSNAAGQEDVNDALSLGFDEVVVLLIRIGTLRTKLEEIP